MARNCNKMCMALLLLYSDPQSHLEAARQTTTMGGVTEFMLRLLEIEHKMFFQLRIS